MNSNSSVPHPSAFRTCSSARPLLFIAGLLLSLVASSRTLSAGEVNHVFTGTVTNVSNAGGTIISSNWFGIPLTYSNRFDASLQYDTSMPPTGSGPQSLVYSNFFFSYAIYGRAPDDSDITLRSLTVSDNTGVSPGPLSDDFLVSVRYSANPGFVTQPYVVTIHLNGATNVFNNRNPPTSLNLGDFDSATFSIENVNNADRIDGMITEIRSFQVPEPTTLSFFALGVIGVALRFRRRYW